MCIPCKCVRMCTARRRQWYLSCMWRKKFPQIYLIKLSQYYRLFACCCWQQNVIGCASLLTANGHFRLIKTACVVIALMTVVGQWNIPSVTAAEQFWESQNRYACSNLYLHSPWIETVHFSSCFFECGRVLNVLAKVVSWWSSAGLRCKLCRFLNMQLP